MNKRYGLLLLFAMALFSLQAETKKPKMRISYHGGWGTYKMDQARNYLLTNVPLSSLKLTDNFPGGYINDLRLGVVVKGVELGLYANSLYTGGQMAQEDYSGRMLFNIDCKALVSGVYGKFDLCSPIRLIEGLKLVPLLQLSAGITVGNSTVINASAEVGEQREYDKLELAGVSYLIEPAAGIAFEVWKGIRISCTAGYSFDVAGELYEKGNRYAKANFRTQWDGLRVLAGISIPIY